MQPDDRRRGVEPEQPEDREEREQRVELVEPVAPASSAVAVRPPDADTSAVALPGDAPGERPSGLRMYRPTPAGLEPNPVELRSWRSGLRSRRWKPAALANPEIAETSTGMAIAFWLILAGLTFVILLVGYGIGFWG